MKAFDFRSRRLVLAVIAGVLMVQDLTFAQPVRYVDPTRLGYTGGAGDPFKNVIEGVLDVPAGGTVYIASGSYAEKMIITKPMQLRSNGGVVTIGKGVGSTFIDCEGGSGPIIDEDGDGILDRCEEVLAQKYAPIVFHSSDESNFPVNVDWYLRYSQVWFFDDGCFPDFKQLFAAAPTQQQLLGGIYTGNCGSNDTVFSDGTRSMQKQRTFFLSDVPKNLQIGSLNTRDWITYYHAYPNSSGGVTIQYWRFYAYNDAINNHGGDWEGIHVVLDRNLNPLSIGFLGHAKIDYVDAALIQWEGNHPRIFSEGGGHASHPTPFDQSGVPIAGWSCTHNPTILDPGNPCSCIRQETWNGGKVLWCRNPTVGFCNGQLTDGGGLLNVGSKIGPLNGQVFVKYSGLWGSPGSTYEFSGYWGPAFNETGMISTPGNNLPFMAAWGAGARAEDLKVVREWYPRASSR